MRAPLSLDTSPEIEERLIEAWRRMTSEEKAAAVTGLTRAALQMAMAGIRDRYPNDPPELQRQRLAEQAARTRSRAADVRRGHGSVVIDLDSCLGARRSVASS